MERQRRSKAGDFQERRAPSRAPSPRGPGVSVSSRGPQTDLRALGLDPLGRSALRMLLPPQLTKPVHPLRPGLFMPRRLELASTAPGRHGPCSPLALVSVWTELSFLGTGSQCCMQGLQEARCSCQAGGLRETLETPTPPLKAVLGRRQTGRKQSAETGGRAAPGRQRRWRDAHSDRGRGRGAPDTCWPRARVRGVGGLSGGGRCRTPGGGYQGPRAGGSRLGQGPCEEGDLEVSLSSAPSCSSASCILRGGGITGPPGPEAAPSAATLAGTLLPLKATTGSQGPSDACFVWVAAARPGTPAGMWLGAFPASDPSPQGGPRVGLWPEQKPLPQRPACALIAGRTGREQGQGTLCLCLPEPLRAPGAALGTRGRCRHRCGVRVPLSGKQQRRPGQRRETNSETVAYRQTDKPRQAMGDQPQHRQPLGSRARVYLVRHSSRAFLP